MFRKVEIINNFITIYHSNIKNKAQRLRCKMLNSPKDTHMNMTETDEICKSDRKTSEHSSKCSLLTSLHIKLNNVRENHYLISPHWIQDSDLQKGQVQFLSLEEELFWKQLIKKYLQPLNEDKKKVEKVARELKKLRDENLLKFFMINALFISIIFLMQINKNKLYLQWPLGITYNVTYYNGGTMEVFIDRNYLHIEPIGCLFIFGFGLILCIQFIAMLFHRFDTFIHLLANTDLKFRSSKKPKDILSGDLSEIYVQDFVKELHRLAEINANPMSNMHQSHYTESPKKHNTIHTLIENQGLHMRLPTDFDMIFRQNLKSPSTSFITEQNKNGAFKNNSTESSTINQSMGNVNRNYTDSLEHSRDTIEILECSNTSNVL